MNAIEGQISIDWNIGSIDPGAVEIKSSRPLQACRLMLGKTPQQVLSIIPLMYNVCAIAQTHASIQSLSLQTGRVLDPRIEMARDILVLAETLREHLLRILMDWPALFNQPMMSNDLPMISGFPRQLANALFVEGKAFEFDSRLEVDSSSLISLLEQIKSILQQQVFEMPIEQWLAIQDLSTIEQWATTSQSIAAISLRQLLDQGWARQGSESCNALPELDSASLSKTLESGQADHFIAAPLWNGQCHETTPLTRQIKHPIIEASHGQYQYRLFTRWLARLVELATLPDKIESALQQIQDSDNHLHTDDLNYGIATVEAARGRLIHRSIVRDDRVTDYQIVAPTEWNFHPEGVLANNLMNIDAPHKDSETLARLMVNAIDPCVGYKLGIH